MRQDNPDKIKISILAIIILHLVGITGILYPPTKEIFTQLTPIHLIICAFILFYNHTGDRTKTWVYAGLCFMIGFTAEVWGVKEGILFGNYNYSNVLGPKLMETPIIIGLNWLILNYVIAYIFQKTSWALPLKVVAGAGLMTFTDMVIEPVAIELNFWQWENHAIPLQNFIGWFIISSILQLLHHLLIPTAHNPAADTLRHMQWAFFIVLFLVTQNIF